MYGKLEQLQVEEVGEAIKRIFGSQSDRPSPRVDDERIRIELGVYVSDGQPRHSIVYLL